MIVLGIESSCDETAAAVVRDGRIILSSVVASQVSTHTCYGGVVPELASRMHVEAIEPVVRQAVSDAGIEVGDISGVAVTQGPGLIGALLVGFNFARAFALGRNLPLAGVNHLEAHIYSLLITDNPPDLPFICLVVSGGHTNIYHVKSPSEFECLGRTRDDAAGEAFDKVAKMMNLGYPGGPAIEKLARRAGPERVAFPRIMLDRHSLDFSFSGLKSAVARHLSEHPVTTEPEKAVVAASFQDAVMDVLSRKLMRAARKKDCPRIAVSGGVAANQSLVSSLKQSGAENRITVFAPPVSLCGDNAAMVAARGTQLLKDNQICPADQDVYSRLPA